MVRFNVAGPQGVAQVQVQVPRDRKRGEFNYIIVQHRRDLIHVLDQRNEQAARKAEEQAEKDAAAFAAMAPPAGAQPSA